MKRFFCVFTALLLVISFIGCKKKEICIITGPASQDSVEEFFEYWEQKYQMRNDKDSKDPYKIASLEKIIVPNVDRTGDVIRSVRADESGYKYEICSDSDIEVDEDPYHITIGCTRERIGRYDTLIYENGKACDADAHTWCIDYEGYQIYIVFPESYEIYRMGEELDDMFVFELYGMGEDGKVVILDDNIFD